MTVRAVRVLRVQVMLRTGGLVRANTVGRTVTRQTELCDAARDQWTWIRRTVRSVTCDASIGLDWCMFVNKRALLVCVTLDASGIGSRRQSRLFELKTAVRIVAIATLHRTFEHFVMERQIELVFRLAMTTETKLRFAVSE